MTPPDDTFWKRAGYFTDCMMRYREHVCSAERHIDGAFRAKTGVSIHMSEALRELRKAVRAVEAARYEVERMGL